MKHYARRCGMELVVYDDHGVCLFRGDLEIVLDEQSGVVTVVIQNTKVSLLPVRSVRHYSDNNALKAPWVQLNKHAVLSLKFAALTYSALSPVTVIEYVRLVIADTFLVSSDNVLVAGMEEKVNV